MMIATDSTYISSIKPQTSCYVYGMVRNSHTLGKNAQIDVRLRHTYKEVTVMMIATDRTWMAAINPHKDIYK